MAIYYEPTEPELSIATSYETGYTLIDILLSTVSFVLSIAVMVLIGIALFFLFVSIFNITRIILYRFGIINLDKDH